MHYESQEIKEEAGVYQCTVSKQCEAPPSSFSTSTYLSKLA